MISLEQVDGVSPYLPGYITGTSLKIYSLVGDIKMTEAIHAILAKWYNYTFDK